MSTCIWCLNESIGNHVEHIVPEALRCPDDFFLTNKEICEGCNNGLGHIDQAVIDDFDFSAFMAGIPRKRGKPPIISSRGNVRGTVGKNGPEISFNMESHAVVDHTGTVLPGFRKRERDVNAQLAQSENQGKVDFSIEFGRRKKFIRGIYKIAFSALTYFVGVSETRKQKYNGIRQYVKKGKGTRHIILGGAERSGYYHSFKPPWVSEFGDYTMQFVLCGVTFIVDLSENEMHYPRYKLMAERLFEDEQWTYLPK